MQRILFILNMNVARRFLDELFQTRVKGKCIHNNCQAIYHV